MQDLAGILMFITGAAGLVLGLAAYVALKRFAWRSSWWGSLLLGVDGCGVVFLVILVYARLHA